MRGKRYKSALNLGVGLSLGVALMPAVLPAHANTGPEDTTRLPDRLLSGTAYSGLAAASGAFGDRQSGGTSVLASLGDSVEPTPRHTGFGLSLIHI